MFRFIFVAFAVFNSAFALPLDGIVEHHRAKRFSGSFTTDAYFDTTPYASKWFSGGSTTMHPFDTTPYESEDETTTGGDEDNGGTKIGFGKNGASISHQKPLLSNDNHQLNGKVTAEKGFDSSPVKIGGNVDYTHKPSSSVFKAGASHSKGSGIDLSASGQYNFLQFNDGKIKIGAYGQVDKNFGGSNADPKWNAGITGKINF